MKNKLKWIAIGTGIALLLAGAILAGMFVFGNDEPQPEGPALQQLKAALDSALTDSDRGAEAGMEVPAFLSEMETRNGYEILSIEQTDTGATAIVRAFAPDLYSAAKRLDAQSADQGEEELFTAISDAIKTARVVEKIVVLNFEKIEDDYIPILTAEFLDAYYGGVFRLYEEILTEAAEKAEEAR